MSSDSIGVDIDTFTWSGTLFVANVDTFPSSGRLYVVTSAGLATLTYRSRHFGLYGCDHGLRVGYGGYLQPGLRDKCLIGGLGLL